MRPPVVAAALLRLLSREDAEYLENDLREEFEALVRARGRAAARHWFWRQTLASLGPLAVARALGVGRAVHGWLVAGRLALRLDRLRYSVRVLRRSPGLTLTVICTLALGIGANAAVFSAINGVLLKPLPYLEPDRLVSIWEETPTAGHQTVTPGNFADYERLNRSFSGLAAYTRIQLTLSNSDPPDELAGDLVSWKLWSILGAQPALGRLFGPEDGHEGSARVAVLTDRLWRSRFASDPAIVGREITLNQESYTIVGVLPPTFQAVSGLGRPEQPSIFVPIALPASALANRQDHVVNVVGRLRPGVTSAQSQQDLDRISQDLARQFPDTNRVLRAVNAPLDQDVVKNVRRSLLVLFGAVSLVVLIACVNVANLLIVWAMGRRREVAIRVALGATRAEIAVDFMIRGLMLSGLGGLAGILVGEWTRGLLVGEAPASIPRLPDVSLDGRVLLVTAVVTIATGIVSGLLPALPLVRHRLAPSLRTTEISASGHRTVFRWRGVLLTVEVAAAMTLALGAGLLVRSLVLLNGIALGFTTHHVLTMTVPLSAARFPDPAARLEFFSALDERTRTIPGVESAAFADQFPMRGGWGGGFLVWGPEGPTPGEADLQAVSVDYFATLGIPLRRGRLFTPADRTAAPAVAIVSDTFVSRYLRTRDPLGAQLQRNPTAPLVTIVGVVGEVRRDGKMADPAPEVYFAAEQTWLYAVQLRSFAVRTGGDPLGVVTSLRRTVASLEPQQGITNLRTLDDAVSGSLATARFSSALLATFAILALALATVGVYGVVAYIASERTREIGIRLALGATRGQVIGTVVARGVGWALAGIGIGLAAALSGARVLSALLFETAPTDPATFAVVTALMTLVAVIASYIPARRAVSMTTLTALRSE
jgi:putative ABC transport system permease protein